MMCGSGICNSFPNFVNSYLGTMGVWLKALNKKHGYISRIWVATDIAMSQKQV